MPSLLKSKRLRPGLGSGSRSKKRMSQPMVSKQLLNKLKKIIEMILPLYIKHLKMLHPKEKVDKSFAVRYSLNIFKKAIKQNKKLKQLKGGSKGLVQFGVSDKEAMEQRMLEDENYEAGYDTDNGYFNKRHGDRHPVTRRRWDNSVSTKHAKDNFDLVSYMAIGLGFFLIMAKFLFN